MERKDVALGITTSHTGSIQMVGAPKYGHFAAAASSCPVLDSFVQAGVDLTAPKGKATALQVPLLHIFSCTQA